MSEGIDFVVTWVDGSDPVWRKDKQAYSGEIDENTDDRDERYREWDMLKYWFRGVEKHAPWVRKIHFVTYGHLPSWLDTENPKLNVVNHRDFIPAEFLPTFNCSVMEIYLHNIPGLSENFIYFNDDMYLMKPVKEKDFFHNGKPCDMLAFQPIIANPTNPVMSHMYMNNSLVLAKYFDKRKGVKEHPGHYFKFGYPPLYFFYNILEMAFPRYTGFYTIHGPSPYTKETFRQVWEKEEALLNSVMKNRFRTGNDITQYLFREWQKLSGNFHPRNMQKDFAYYEISEDNKKLCQCITKQKKKVLCVNDTFKGQEFERVKAEVSGAFEQIFPEKSSFERR